MTALSLQRLRALERVLLEALNDEDLCATADFRAVHTAVVRELNRRARVRRAMPRTRPPNIRRSME